MHRLSRNSRLRLIMLLPIAISLAACSPPRRPDPPPVVIQGQKPKVDAPLMQPPKVGAINQLLNSLGLPLVSAGTPSTN